jgi:uncharacterized membrane protein
MIKHHFSLCIGLINFLGVAICFPLALLTGRYGGSFPIQETATFWVVGVMLAALTALALVKIDQKRKRVKFLLGTVFAASFLLVSWTALASAVITCAGVGSACGDYSYSDWESGQGGTSF